MNEESFYKDMGARVQRERRKLALTQEALGSMVGLTRTSIVNIEKGRQKILAHTLSAMARALRVTVNDLLPAEVEANGVEKLLRGKPQQDQAFVRSVLAAARKEG